MPSTGMLRDIYDRLNSHPRVQLNQMPAAALPEITLWFCGSCGCYDRSQEHKPDCNPAKRTPRVPVVYVPMNDV